MKRLTMMSLAVLLVLGMSSVASAQTIDDLRLGDHWYGEKWDTDDLKGRVVLMEIWGFN